MSVCARAPPRSSGFLCKACGRRRRWRRRHGRSPIVFFLRRLVGSSGALLDAAAKGRVSIRLGSARVLAAMKTAKKRTSTYHRRRKRRWHASYCTCFILAACSPSMASQLLQSDAAAAGVPSMTCLSSNAAQRPSQLPSSLCALRGSL